MLLGCKFKSLEFGYFVVDKVHRRSYAKDMPFSRLLEDAVVLPLFDGGNVGVRRRQLEKIFQREDYKPWAATYGE
jgi:hypothetical protein